MRAFNPQSIPRPEVAGFEPSILSCRPLDLEIGAGQGFHAIRYCQANPQRTLIAVERTQNRFSSLQKRAANHPGLTNLIALRADAIPFVSHFIAEQTLSRIFLLYPNPYPKSSQANQRWHRSPFVAFLKSRLAPGGTLHLATNLEWYANEAAQWLCKEQNFRLLENRKIDRDFVPRTHFEHKYLARGESCFDLVFENGLQ